MERKPYLGGYRDKRNGLEYHHAFSQTPVERVSKWAGKAQRFERETQTSKAVTRSVQSKRECYAQTGRHDLLLDTTHDVECRPRPYFTADQLLAVKEAKALVIQCQWRGYMSRTKAAEIRLRLESQRAAALEEAQRKTLEDEAKLARDVERRLHPRTLEDFAILYDEVEAWRVAETAKIKASRGGEEAQKEALAVLLQHETAMLGMVEQKRSLAAKLNAESSVARRMETMAAPKVWALGDGSKALVHTPYTTRAQELKALFDGVAMEGLPPADRMELLMHVRATVSEFDCALSREIVSLTEREVDMMQRGRPAESLAGARQRLRTLFLTFCETPEFNPEASRFSAAALSATTRTKCLNTTTALPPPSGGAGAGPGGREGGAGLGGSGTAFGGTRKYGAAVAGGLATGGRGTASYATETDLVGSSSGAGTGMGADLGHA
jgi:hypothetical protein